MINSIDLIKWVEKDLLAKFTARNRKKPKLSKCGPSWEKKQQTLHENQKKIACLQQKIRLLKEQHGQVAEEIGELEKVLRDADIDEYRGMMFKKLIEREPVTQKSRLQEAIDYKTLDTKHRLQREVVCLQNLIQERVKQQRTMQKLLDELCEGNAKLELAQARVKEEISRKEKEIDWNIVGQ
ncbi:hypothetical protein M8J75_012049 [Diaphorina citri]|nr:hypothetical protein M8J75_012049 [Diaphorina citri]KAI5707505.1 hypothetical protein M8J77_004052 [Diaphorina citri]